jgi:hypothetical protein
MPEQHMLMRGHEVDMILEYFAGHRGFRIETEYLPGEVFPVSIIGGNVAGKQYTGKKK